MSGKLRTIYLPNMEHGDTSTHYWLFFSGMVVGAFALFAVLAYLGIV
jgi:hypothetical protein